MAIANRDLSNGETSHSTKRVFMRAEQGDEVVILTNRDIEYDELPEHAEVIRRDITYYGPKLRVEANGRQYILTAPGPTAEAMLWRQTQSADWKPAQEVKLDFGDSLPKYDICQHCNEPLDTMAHRRRSIIGACR